MGSEEPSSIAAPHSQQQQEVDLPIDIDPTADGALVEVDHEISLAEIVHSLSRLLPDSQNLTWFEAGTPVSDALVVLQRTGYSQAPVRQGQRYVGVFSYRSFARMAAMAGNTGPLTNLTVADCVDQLPFATVDETIEDIFGHLDKFDAVLVGSRDEPRGIVTVMDTLRYLFKLANGYVLMQQVELGLRHAIRICVDDRILAESVEIVLAKKYEASNHPAPQRLVDMNITDLISLITSRRTSERFFAVFGHNTPLVKSSVDPLPRIRNDLFHFRNSLSIDDYERLATTRDWLLNRLDAAELRGSYESASR